MNRTTTIGIGLIAVAIVLGVTACTGDGAPTPTSSSTQGPTTTNQPTLSPTGVDPPIDSDDAWEHATDAITDFLVVQSAIQADAGAGVDRIEPYATGEALDGVRQVAAQLSEKQIRVDGDTFFTPNAAASSFGDLTTAQATIPNGVVYVVGCYDSSKQMPRYADGTDAPVPDVRVVPVQFVVTYVPEALAWRVERATNITAQDGAPSC